MKIRKHLLIALYITCFGYACLWLFDFVTHTNVKNIEEKKSKNFRVAVANIHFENNNTEETNKVLATINSDVLIILEYSGKNLDLDFFRNIGYEIIIEKPINSPHGMCALVKNEMYAQSELIKTPYSSPCQMPFSTIRIKAGNEYISIWGVHTPPPVPTCKFTTSATIQALAKYVENGRLVKKLGISQKDDIIIMAGDFNIFWFHPAINELKQTGLYDCYSELNMLPAATWAPFSWFPKFVGLDYIFCSKILKPVNLNIIKIKGSDHSCVMADIELN